MKQLLIKEYKLTASLLTFLFLGFAAMTMIPGYPILVGVFFICLGIFYTFQFGREFNDVLYTALLPVAKKDVVKARFAFVISIQMTGYLLCLILTLIRMSFLSEAQPYVNNALMNANLFYLAGYFIIMSLYNTIFVAGFFKTAYYFGKPFILFCVFCFLFIGIMETLHHIPGLEFLNTCGWNYVVIQGITLFVAAVLYVLLTAIAIKKSIAHFEKTDL